MTNEINEIVKRKPGRPRGSKSKAIGSHYERAKRLLEEKAEVLVQHVLTAAEVASKKGDSKPAMDLLTHMGDLSPLKPSIDKQVATDNGPKILINLPQVTSLPEVIDVKKLTE